MMVKIETTIAVAVAILTTTKDLRIRETLISKGLIGVIHRRCPSEMTIREEKINIEEDTFGITENFQEGQCIKIGKTAMKMLGMGDEEFYEGMGVYFIALAQELGYGMLLSCLGRCFRDFFVNLDNLHDYLKFTFPR